MSVPVVSKVLNGGKKNNSRVSAATRARILSLAQEMGYRSNTAAQTIRTGKFNAVGLLMSQHSHQSTVFGEMLRGIHQGLDEHGYHLTVNFIDDQRLTSQDDLPKVLGQAMVDGMILNYTHAAPPAMVALLERQSMPTVWVNAKREQNCVYIDDFGGARLATQRYLEQGFERVMYADFTGLYESASELHYSRMDRRAGYEAAMREAGHEPLSTIAPRCDRDAIGAATRLLRSPHAPDAVVTYASPEADAFANAAYACGLVPGRDLHIATFSPHLLFAGPVYDVYVLPEFAMGMAAARALLQRIKAPLKNLKPSAVPFVGIPAISS